MLKVTEIAFSCYPVTDMARARKRFEQREKIGAAMGFFDMRSATVSPQELLAAYEARKDTFTRPARAHVFQLVLRPTDPAERQALNDDQSRVFRQAQDADPQSAAVVAPFLEKLVALDPEAPERAALLDEAMTALAALPLQINAAPALRELVEAAGKLVERRAAMRTPAEVEARLTALRQELDGQGEAAFRAAAQRLSQGARAEDGGDLGWLEPGVFAKELDAAVFALQEGQLSHPLWSEQVCCLMFMAERTQATQRSFAEVVGELESLLRQERQAGIRKRAAGMLRQRAVVRESIRLRREARDVLQARVDAGTTPELDLARADTEMRRSIANGGDLPSTPLDG